MNLEREWKGQLTVRDVLNREREARVVDAFLAEQAATEAEAEGPAEAADVLGADA